MREKAMQRLSLDHENRQSKAIGIIAVREHWTKARWVYSEHLSRREELSRGRENTWASSPRAQAYRGRVYESPRREIVPGCKSRSGGRQGLLRCVW